MTIFRQSYEAAKYHKRVTATFFLLFSISALLITFVSQLLSTERTTLDSISLTMDDMNDSFPQVSQDLGGFIFKNNHSLIQFYQHLELILLFVSFLIFLFFGFFSAKIRKDELKSLHCMGASRFKMMNYFICELLIPLIVISSFLSLVFFVAQQQIINASFSTNKIVMNYRFDDSKLYTQNNSEVTKLNHSLSESDSTDKALVPYNKKTAFETKQIDQSVSKSLFCYIKSLSRLVGLALSGCLIGFSSYIIPNFTRKKSLTS